MTHLVKHVFIPLTCLKAFEVSVLIHSALIWVKNETGTKIISLRINVFGRSNSTKNGFDQGCPYYSLHELWRLVWSSVKPWLWCFKINWRLNNTNTKFIVGTDCSCNPSCRCIWSNQINISFWVCSNINQIPVPCFWKIISNWNGLKLISTYWSGTDRQPVETGQ